VLLATRGVVGTPNARVSIATAPVREPVNSGSAEASE
jgi:hypothetical protein